MACVWTWQRPILVALLFLGLNVLGLNAVPAFADGPTDANALWKIVHRQCVPDQQQRRDPAPCADVDLSAGEQQGYAVLKDIVGATQFLLIPTARITGIESPELLARGAPNYFAAAWRARTFVDERAHRILPRDWVSLAINSAAGRTQDQLHIHVDCVREDVRAALSEYGTQIGDAWTPFPVPLAGHHYLARWVAGDDLDGVDPFTLLADAVEGARGDMGSETLVVVGIAGTDGPGFVILADHADAATGNPGTGEELQDHSCALLDQQLL